jgi:hypothetical protein
MTGWRNRIFVAFAFIVPAPVLACSGPGTQGHAYYADVIVSGTSFIDDKTLVREVVAKKIIKGIKTARYIVEYEGVIDDECAFLSAGPRDRGVYFLKRKNDGTYVVIWTEKRWKKRWKTGL